MIVLNFVYLPKIQNIMPKYIKEEIVHERVDVSTGEITTIIEKQFQVKVDTEAYFMIYADSQAIFTLDKIADVKVLLAICELAVYNTGELPMTMKQRRLVSSKAKVSHANLSKNTSRLVEKGFLAVEEGTYYINPRVSWRGDRKKRRELMNNADFMSRFNVSL